MVSPTAGVGSFTDFDTERSTDVGVILTEAESFAAFESASFTAVTVAVFVMVLPPVPVSTVADMLRVAVVVVLTVPTVHTPVTVLYAPWLAVGVPVRVTPVGRISVSTTPVAVSGPPLVSVMV